jgi:uncharacterized membrane protein YfhO
MKDSKGSIVDRPIIVSKFTYLLSKSINKNVFLSYIRNKFYLYDQVQFLKDFDNVKIEDVIKKNENLAFVAGPLSKEEQLNFSMLQAKVGASSSPLSVSNDTEKFKVVDFDPDHIQLITNFNTGKFLVYTDSFEKYWKVFINDHEQKLYRANIAFKGVWLPAGKDKVVFQYTMPGAKELYLLVLLLNCFLLIFFLRLMCLK